MSDLILNNNSPVVTMSSLELVQFINNQRDSGASELRHDHFMAKVPLVLGVEDAPNFRGIYFDAYGREKPCYHFKKREACLMAMSYSYDLQAKVFDRMTDLESAKAAPVINSDESRLLMIQELATKQLALIHENKEQKAQLAIASPKAEALDLIANADGMLNLQAAGKTLQQQPNKFIAWLRENGWIYKRPGSVSNSARAEKFNAGYLATKSHVVVLPDGSERVRDQVMVTPKGLAKLAGVFSVGVAKNA